NSRLPTTLNARDQPPAEVSDQRVSGLTGAVQENVSARIGRKIMLGPLDGMICDVHIYKETYAEACKRLANLDLRRTQFDAVRN
ncbi:hypothetical protein DSI35_22440, partial [Mycobacterium tuberculosis]